MKEKTEQINWWDRFLYRFAGKIPNKPGVADFIKEQRKKHLDKHPPLPLLLRTIMRTSKS